MFHRLLALVLIGALTGCSLWKRADKGNELVAKPEPLYGSPLGLTGELNQFGSCQELESWLKDEALKRAAHELAWERYYRVNGSEVVMAEAPVADTAEGSSAGGRTATNNQVAGVDEDDSFKHIGDHIYALGANGLHIVKSWPASELALEGRLAFSYVPQSMLIANDRAAVFGMSSDGQAPGMGSEGRATTVPACPDCWSPGSVVVSLVDLATPAQPKLLNEQKRPGMLVAARLVGSKVRYVVQTTPSYPKDFRTYLGSYTGPQTLAEVDALVATTMTRNAEALQNWGLKDWFGSDESLSANDCQAIYRPTAHSELALTRVVTVELASGAEHVSAILAQASEVYASEKNLYVANHYWAGRGTDFGSQTFLHKFAIGEEDVRYEASGAVEGYILNQFAMDEKDDHLRIAVTTQGAGMQERATASVNRVVTFAQEDNRLVVKGQTPDLAPGERIYSVRFDGDKGYVVTFRQIDPLFVMDLANPLEPKVTGELKIPGFSSYLHKVGENRLLGVGRQDQYMKLSLFDVSNPRAPSELNALLVEGWTSVDYDHHSFSFAPWLATFVMPRSSAMNQGLSSFRIENDAIVKGKFFSAPLATDGWQSSFQTLRSAFRDNVLYTVTSGGIAAHDLAQDGVLLKNVAFP